MASTSSTPQVSSKPSLNITINGLSPLKNAARSDPNPLSEKQRLKLKKKKKKKLKSIGKRHPEFELTYDMMLGIRYAVSLSEPSVTTTTRSRTVTATHTLNTTHTHDTHLSIYNASSHSTQHSISESVTPDSSDSSDDSDDERMIENEFLESKKYRFPSSGSDTTPAHQMSDFKFKDYCPQIFRQLREWFRISTQEYLVTICGDFRLLEFISNSKSGQFFFFSHNSQFIIKTMTRTESIFLRRILPSYYRYVSQQPDTLLPKFYGMHRVKRKKQKIYFLIQQNVFYSDVDDIHGQFDLKGSTQGRRATKAERKKGAILKDLDWVDEDQTINIGPERAKLFKDQLKRDTHWLRREKIMDYSLLVGIHYLDRAKSSPPSHPNKDKDSNNQVLLLDHSTPDNNTTASTHTSSPSSQHHEQKYAPPLPPVTEDDDEDRSQSTSSQPQPYPPQQLFSNETQSQTTIQPSITSPASETPTTPNNARSKLELNSETPSKPSETFPEHVEPLPERSRRHSTDENVCNNTNPHAHVRHSSAPMAAPREMVSISATNRHKFSIDSEDDESELTRHKGRTGSLDRFVSASADFAIHRSDTHHARSKTYRGHISLKHPKHYKRKTAAQMQFAVDDIDIPDGVRMEVSEEYSSVHNEDEHIDVNAIEVELQEEKVSVVEDGMGDMDGIDEAERARIHSVEARQVIERDEEDEARMERVQSARSVQSTFSMQSQEEKVANGVVGDSVDGVVSADMCPWTDFHGGMVLEDEETGTVIGNEVYFVGLIDILQKYNKRKKLENWIKKMKYDSIAISAAPPDLYAQRMCDFFDDKVV